MKKIVITFILSFILISAQSQESIIQDTLKEVVITAQYVPDTPKNTMHNIKVIPRKILLEKGAIYLDDILEQYLGVHLIRHSVIGTSLEMDGLGKENIKILIDGVPVVGRLNGVLDLSRIPLHDVERIEIIEGPTSVYYGTDAMGGVINIITKKQPRKPLEAQFQTYYESIGALNLSGVTGLKRGNTYGRLGFGKYDFKGANRINAPSTKNWPEREHYYGNILIGQKINKYNLTYRSGGVQEKLLHIGEPDRRSNVKDKTYYTAHFNHYLNFKGSTGFGYLDVLGSAQNYYRFHDTFIVDLNNGHQTPDQKDTRDKNKETYDYTGIKATLGAPLKNNILKLGIGTDIHKEMATGQRIKDHAKSLTTSAVFGSITYTLKKISMEVSGRWNYNSIYKSVFSPAIHFKTVIHPNHLLKFGYSNGYRSPSIKELYLDFRTPAGPVTYIISGNPDLKPERGHHFQFTHIYDKKLSNNKRISTNVQLFYNNITSLIALSEMQNFQKYYLNIDRFKSLGAKMEMKYEQCSFKSTLGVAYIGRYNKFSNNFDTETFLYTPELTSSLHYEIPGPKLKLNLFYKYIGPKPGFYINQNSGDLTKFIRKEIHHMDFSLSKSVFSSKLHISAGVKNLLNVTNIESVTTFGDAHNSEMYLWGRTYFINLNIKL